jgi:hypothetical protein
MRHLGDIKYTVLLPAAWRDFRDVFSDFSNDVNGFIRIRGALTVSCCRALVCKVSQLEDRSIRPYFYSTLSVTVWTVLICSVSYRCVFRCLFLYHLVRGRVDCLDLLGKLSLRVPMPNLRSISTLVVPTPRINLLRRSSLFHAVSNYPLCRFWYTFYFKLYIYY